MGYWKAYWRWFIEPMFVGLSLMIPCAFIAFMASEDFASTIILIPIIWIMGCVFRWLGEGGDEE